MNRILRAGAVALLLSACGGTVVEEATGAGTSGTGAATTNSSGASTTGAGAGTSGVTNGTAVSGTGTGTSSGIIDACPAGKPVAGTPCSFDQAACSYGDAVRPDCRSVLQCANGAWQDMSPSCSPPTAACPATNPNGAGCAGEGDVCTYGDTICFCGCTGGDLCPPPDSWSCTAPPGQGCPSVAPNEGSVCTAEGQACPYGPMCTAAGVEAQCSQGTWMWVPAECGL